MIDTNNFYQSEKQLTEKDLQTCEQTLGITLPDSLKALYLRCNGGLVYKDCFTLPNLVDKLKIALFMPIKYNLASDHDPDFLIEGTVQQLWQQHKLEKTLLPFALDYSDSFICINLNNGAIYRYRLWDWDDSLTHEQNFTENSDYLSASLDDFLNALTEDK